MAFASIYVPNFMLQAVLCAEPILCGCAVALLDGTPPLSSVVTVNDSVERAGVEIGMTESQFAQFHGVEKRNRSRACEESLHAALLQMCWSISPCIEDTAPDTIILDLAGLHRFFGSKDNIAHELMRRASELGLEVNVAVAKNIDAALHAARGFRGITLIPVGEESKRIGCLPVRVLSPSTEVLETLEGWGVYTCAQFAALPVLQLSERLGQEGVRLHGLASGTSVRSLTLARTELRFEETIELDDAVEELEPLAFLLGRLLDQLCVRLQACALAAASIHLRFDLGDAFEKEAQLHGEATSIEPTQKIYEKTMRLPVPVRNSKLLLNLLRLQLQADPPQASVLKITLAAEPAQRRGAQGNLFRRTSIDPDKWELTLARLSNLAGSSNVGSPEVVDAHRPATFQMKRFAPPAHESTIRRKTGRVVSKANRRNNESERKAIIALRHFRPEWLAKIATCENRPLYVSLRGMHGNIVAASGPWFTSGDWWREEKWRHDEWDVFIRFDACQMLLGRDLHWEAQDGLYRIYYDRIRRNWFVRGRYD
jgi:protein ImuB